MGKTALLTDNLIGQPYWTVLLDSLIEQPYLAALFDSLIRQPYGQPQITRIFPGTRGRGINLSTDFGCNRIVLGS